MHLKQREPGMSSRGQNNDARPNLGGSREDKGGGGSSGEGGGGLAQHSTIKEMDRPHRLDLGAWAKQRAVYSAGPVVEVEAAVLFKLG